jgi:hypothetical protein
MHPVHPGRSSEQSCHCSTSCACTWLLLASLLRPLLQASLLLRLLLLLLPLLLPPPRSLPPLLLLLALQAGLAPDSTLGLQQVALGCNLYCQVS